MCASAVYCRKGDYTRKAKRKKHKQVACKIFCKAFFLKITISFFLYK